jgi:transmembrane 9 superfamily protein 1
LGEVLEGDRMVNTRYNVTFKVDKAVEDLCTVTLNPAEISKFKKAVEQDYYFQVCASSFYFLLAAIPPL